MTEDEGRQAVVAAARSYIGTPYHHHGKIKGVGVDCGTLLTLVFAEAGVRDSIELGQYSTQWHLHRGEPIYEDTVKAAGCHEVEEPKLGDIVLYKIGRQFAHGGIVTCIDPLTFVHAFMQVRCVIETPENESGVMGLPRKFYSAW